ncbi:MBL fold metallo-hydrolase [Thalassolituus sp.]|uniref:MBL fold metallo-hydrolase n=1 Tax=Thalassolituus sp. TaxID=2030822 RepID=UPI0035130FD2
MSYRIKSYFHQDTSTFTHLLWDVESSECAVIDPVMDFDSKAGRTTTVFIDEVLADVQEQGLFIKYVMETHAHADHLTSAAYIREKTGAKLVIGARITGIQKVFSGIFNEGSALRVDGSQFDILLDDGEALFLGDTRIQSMATPGHTPACASYVVEQRDVFVGDTLFMPDVGSARCDFPGGDAGTLYDSVQRVLALGDDVVLHMCHDYPPGKRDVRSAVTVAEQRRNNIHVGDQHSRDDFIRMRTERDAELEMPRLIFPSLQVNIRAGDFPEPESNGVSYLKIPMNQF